MNTSTEPAEQDTADGKIESALAWFDHFSVAVLVEGHVSNGKRLAAEVRRLRAAVEERQKKLKLLADPAFWGIKEGR